MTERLLHSKGSVEPDSRFLPETETEAFIAAHNRQEIVEATNGSMREIASALARGEDIPPVSVLDAGGTPREARFRLFKGMEQNPSVVIDLVHAEAQPGVAEGSHIKSLWWYNPGMENQTSAFIEVEKSANDGPLGNGSYRSAQLHSGTGEVIHRGGSGEVQDWGSADFIIGATAAAAAATQLVERVAQGSQNEAA
jgi:hypothetical protein